jgi:hypothetical protein
VFVLITAVAVAILLLLSMPWRHWREQARNGAAAATASMGPEGPLAGGANGVPGVSSGPDTALASAAAPARSAVLAASRPPAVGQGDGRDRTPGGDGPRAGAGQSAAPEQLQDDDAGNGQLPRDGTSTRRAAGDGDGLTPWQYSGADADLGAGDGAGAAPWRDSGDGTEPGASDVQSFVQVDDGRPPEPRDEVSGRAGWPCVGQGDREPAGGARPAGFESGESGGPSAVGALPPAVSDSDWAWFRPTAGSLPDIGRSREP